MLEVESSKWNSDVKEQPVTSLPLSKIFGGAMLVAGTCIGAGMLALPVSTAAAGFYPSAWAFLAAWFMMTLSAFLMLEASLWFPQDTNLITMAKSTLGKPGEVIAWCTYVLFLYALITAYTSGASGIITRFLGNVGLPENWAMWMLALMFGAIVYSGTRWVDRSNRLLMAVLIGAYCALVVNVAPKASHELLLEKEPRFLWSVAPLLVTSFGFHLTIPSLRNYLKGHVKGLRIAIFAGSLIPLVVYLLWELMILGSVPVKGEQGLVSMMLSEQETGKQAVVELTQMLSQELNNPTVTLVARVFGLFAILSSLIGVSLGFFDFFSDGFNIKKTVRGKFVLALITFLPPVLIAIWYPRFLDALHYAGFFAAILLVIYPALMVWFGRYRIHLSKDTHYRLMGGKALVIIVLIFGLSVMGLELLDRFHMLPTPLAQKHLFE